MTFERVFGDSLGFLLKTIVPYKKIFVKTDCQVHIFNNHQALRLLKDFRYLDVYHLMRPYIKDLNKGSVWADQNFKSTSHFYNPKTNKGMFGHNNALHLAETYYSLAHHLYDINQVPKAMFYLGACIHIIQDLTIPQHVRVRLLDHHRGFENFVKCTYDLVEDYRSIDPPIVLPTIKNYLDYNARIALKVDYKYKDVVPLRLRFFKITLSCLPLAQSTSAGCLVRFYQEVEG